MKRVRARARVRMRNLPTSAAAERRAWRQLALPPHSSPSIATGHKHGSTNSSHVAFPSGSAHAIGRAGRRQRPLRSPTLTAGSLVAAVSCTPQSQQQPCQPAAIGSSSQKRTGATSPTFEVVAGLDARRDLHLRNTRVAVDVRQLE